MRHVDVLAAMMLDLAGDEHIILHQKVGQAGFS